MCACACTWYLLYSYIDYIYVHMCVEMIFFVKLLLPLLLLQVVTTLNILSTIANAMGSSSVKYVKVLMPGTMNVLSDSKVCPVYSSDFIIMISENLL